MTWRDIADFTDKLTEAEKDKDVKFLEPYDDASGFYIQIARADCDKHVDNQMEELRLTGEPFIKQGEYYLW